MPVDNSEIAAIFDQIANFLEIGEANRFRVRACRDALAEGKITERRVRIDTAEDFGGPADQLGPAPGRRDQGRDRRQLPPPLGAILTSPWIERPGPDVPGGLLAMPAGGPFHVGATHLLPMTEREPRRFSMIALASGRLTAVGIVLGARG